MIRADFYRSGRDISGFRIVGHSGYADSGSDIVCSAVSSAVQFAVNLLDDFGCRPKVSVGEDAVIDCRIRKADRNSARIADGLRLHLMSVAEEFPDNVKVTVLEVQYAED